jgi:hypothetical protein
MVGDTKINIISLNGCPISFFSYKYIYFSGFMSTHIDMAPNFAGTLLGITNGFGNTMGFLAPAITGYIINANQDLAHWRTVFFIGKSRKISQDSHIS